jgi:hypothetical protein
MITKNLGLQPVEPTAETDGTTPLLTNLATWRLSKGVAADTLMFPTDFQGYHTLWRYEICKGMTVRWASKIDPFNSFKGLVFEAVHNLEDGTVKIFWDTGDEDKRAVKTALYDELIEFEISAAAMTAAKATAAVAVDKTTATEKIALLNDNLRAKLKINSACLSLTMGIMGLGKEALAPIVEGIAAYQGFSAGEDPFNERDFGVFELSIGSGKSAIAHQIAWKIDYYDNNLELNSPDPANPALTCRIITVSIEGEFS